MSKPSVLIVGAGAVGVVTGYHFTLGGTSVTFYVRPTRREVMLSPQILYCYDDGLLKTYSDYELVSSAADVALQRFEFVIVTFDAMVCRSAEGIRLLSDLADAIRESSAVMIICGVGLGLFEHVLDVTELPADRVMEGTLGNVSHQVNAPIRLHPPTDPATLAKASLAYRHFSGKTGFTLVAQPRDAAQRFAAIYNRCGISSCVLSKRDLFRLYTNSFFGYTVASELAGWPDIAGLASRRPLLTLATQAMKEVASLREFGWTGRLMRALLSERMLLRMIRKLEKDILPLDLPSFNQFHHGGKVLTQDISVLRGCVRTGEKQGKPMRSLRELLRRFDERQIGSSDVRSAA